MATNTRAYWLHCLTPTHVGTGRGIGYIDLPLYREATTNWPAVPGSGFKGVWADHYRATKEARAEKSDKGQLLRAAFGAADVKDGDTGRDSSNAGALIATDARLVCLPVRSFKGTFAWATSPLALRFLQRDLALAHFGKLPEVPATTDDALVAQKGTLAIDGHVYLEDLDLPEKVDPVAGQWAKKLAGWVFAEQAGWQEEFVKRFVVLPDLIFDHLAETGTEVSTRVRIDDDTKTVADGQLWTEESLPAESILFGIITCDRVYGVKDVNEAKLVEEFATKPLQLQVGGKASVGRGKVRCVFTPVEGSR